MDQQVQRLTRDLEVAEQTLTRLKEKTPPAAAGEIEFQEKLVEQGRITLLNAQRALAATTSQQTTNVGGAAAAKPLQPPPLSNRQVPPHMQPTAVAATSQQPMPSSQYDPAIKAATPASEPHSQTPAPAAAAKPLQPPPVVSRAPEVARFSAASPQRFSDPFEAPATPQARPAAKVKTSAASPKKPLPPAALPKYHFPTAFSNGGSSAFHDFIDRASYIIMAIANDDHPGGDGAICDAIDTFISDWGCHVDQLFALSNTPAGCTTTFLIHAIDHSRSEIVRHLLLKHKATPGRQYPELGNDCALHRACYLGQVEVVRWLLDASEYNITELRNANKHRCFDVFNDSVSLPMQRELEALCCGVVEGAAPAIDTVDQIAALEAVQDRTSTRALEALLAKHPKTLATYVMELELNEMTNLLYSAARYNNPNAIRVLLDHGADPNQQVLHLSTPLHVACYRGHVECVEALMRHTPPPRTDIVNSYNETCLTVFRDDVTLDAQRRIRCLVLVDVARLFKALESDDVESFKEAFGYDDPNVPIPSLDGSRMVSLLQEAAEHMSEHVLQFLLSRGATKVDEALFIACHKGKIACVRALLNYGASRDVVAVAVKQFPLMKKTLAEFLPAVPIEAKVSQCIRANDAFNEDEADALLEEWSQKHQSIDSMLIDAPTEAEGPVSPLWLACCVGNAPMVSLLISKHGASAGTVEATTDDTALHIACRRGHERCVELLLEAGSNLFAKNVAQECPGDAYDVDVPPGTKTAIETRIKNARTVANAELEQQHVKQYIDTIGHRVVIDCDAATKLLHSISDLTRVVTLSDLRTHLTAVLKIALYEAATKSAGNNNQLNDQHIILREFLSVLRTNCATKALEVLVTSHTTAFDPKDVLALPHTSTFTAAVNIPELVRSVTMASTSEYFGRRFQSLFPTAASTGGSNAFQDRLDAVVKGKNDPFTRCHMVFETLLDIFREEVVKYRRTLRGPVVATFVELWVKDHLEDTFGRCANWAKLQRLLEVATDKPEEIFLLPEVAFSVVGFLQNLINRWANLPNVAELASEFGKLIIHNQSVGAAVSCRQTLEMSDVACEKHIAMRLEVNVNKWVTPILAATPSGSFGTSKRYIDACTANAVATAIAAFQKDGILKGPKKDLLFSPDHFDVSIFEKQFHVAATMQQVVSDVRDEQEKELKKENLPQVNRYLREMDRILTEFTSHPTTSQSLMLQIEGIIRRVHLNTVWSKMQAYEQLDELKDAMNQSDVILVEADTGSGKSVLLPQYICEYLEYNTIVTQPRREATVSTGQHVAVQFSKSYVGYQVEGIDNPCAKGKLQYFTDMFYLGKALSAAERDLTDVCVVIDEVHERNATTQCWAQQFPNVRLKIVLASATIGKSDFFEKAAQSFRFSFKHVHLPVQSRYQVKEEFIPHPQVQAGVEDPSNKAKRDLIGAHHALKIVKNDPKAKVIVFLPHRNELESADKEFQKLCGGQVESHAMHAQTLNARAKLQTGRVFFANNVLETTFTVPELSHVIDFNHAMFQEIDSEKNTRELKICLATQSSQKQRRGRLGRVQDGTYLHYYDPNILPLSHPVSFEQLTNDVILQYEIRSRYYLQRSLFAGSSPTLQVLGAGGVPPRPSWVMDMIPKDPNDLKIAATLSLPGGFALAFLHALKKKSCPLAILWLETMMECRTPITVGGVPLPAQYATVGLGQYGDFGIMLEIYDKYLKSKAQLGTKFDAQTFCKADNLSHFFLENVEKRLASVDLMLNKALNIDTTRWADKSKWKWDDIEDALLAGYKRQVVKQLSTTLQSGTYLSNDFQGPYRLLDGNQMHALSLFGNSAWVNNGPSPMPEYLLCHTVESIKGRSFLKFVCSVSAAAVKNHIPADVVTQSIGLVYGDVKNLKDYNQNVLGLPGPSFLADYRTSIAGAATCTITEAPRRSNATPPPPLPWTSAITKRWKTGAANINIEFVCTGSRLGVAELMDAIAKDVASARLYAQQVAALQAANNPALSALFQSPKPSATFADIRLLDGKIADRLDKATNKNRTDQDLKAAIAAGGLEQGLALCNVLLNKYNFVIKGGFVRDCIVRGLTTFKDFDIELPAATITQNNWAAEIQRISNDLKNKFGVTCGAPVASNFNGTASMIRVVTVAPLQVELECVAPWNTAYIPCKRMDFSVNNLRLESGSQSIHQQVGFGMTVQQIIGQLKNATPQASPLYDTRFAPGSGNETGEGYSRNLYAKAVGNAMPGRLVWARKKGFWMVEPAFLTATGPNQSYTLYHGTGGPAAQSILQGGFKPSTGGNLGAGVYMSRDITICLMFQKVGGNILSATVDVGSLFLAKGFDQTGSNWAGFDAVLLEQQFSPRAPPLEEWVIRDPAKIRNIAIYM
ncbi:ankyrin repeat protein, putative [Bodo saltans]|uniref:Ankyrin repeat protein, putative n=1 Tax=Bodo saltans TaxID=75058 RepID=A0A0S4IT64_BODSA|nr:ankyrin repeat protein, putative [Bodo saltans]|eukprot:CUF76357.1 ankyrin repeat protein, putative [Bodo saltans]